MPSIIHLVKRGMRASVAIKLNWIISILLVARSICPSILWLSYQKSATMKKDTRKMKIPVKKWCESTVSLGSGISNNIMVIITPITASEKTSKCSFKRLARRIHHCDRLVLEPFAVPWQIASLTRDEGGWPLVPFVQSNHSNPFVFSVFTKASINSTGVVSPIKLIILI